MNRRKLEAENRALRTRLDDCQALLAAIALEQGNGELVVNGSFLEQVAKDAETHTFAVRVMTNGDLRVDFTKPELTMTVTEEASCSST